MSKVKQKISLVLSFFLSIVVVNYLIPVFCVDCKPGFITQVVRDYNFDSKYIFWGKPYCKKDCDNDLEKLSTSKVVTFGENYGDCQTILFLGDSFTDSPWNDEGRSYAEHFAESLSENKLHCYRLMRLAANGTGTDQQFARFEDTVEEIKPKIVAWQFYWNDFYDNIEKSLYELNDDVPYRKKPFTSAYFWSGLINQKTPFLDGTNLGDFLLYFGELKKDFYIDWLKIESNPDSILLFNDKKISALLKEMKKLEKKYNFKLITTLSPLECEFILPDGCKGLDNPMNPYLFSSKIQTDLQNILKNNSSYVSMFKNESAFEIDELNELDFWKEESTVGSRHLGANGQEKAGKILFLNYISLIN